MTKAKIVSTELVASADPEVFERNLQKSIFELQLECEVEVQFSTATEQDEGVYVVYSALLIGRARPRLREEVIRR